MKRIIKGLETRRDELTAELKRINLYKAMLYEQGKYSLEPSVREAFRLIGFNVKDPEEYKEDYDLYAEEDGIKVIGEIEGSDKQIDVVKVRQLHDYVSAEILDGNKCKGILIGNGFRSIEPPERAAKGDQFTKHAVDVCNTYGYCRMTTIELFRVVRKIFDHPSDICLKDIKKQIMACKGEFKLSEK